jgi:hypothetical protein
MFLSNHPKFNVEIPLNPSQKTPLKNPNSIQAEVDDFTAAVEIEDLQPDNSFVIHPQRSSRPEELEQSNFSTCRILSSTKLGINLKGERF